MKRLKFANGTECLTPVQRPVNTGLTWRERKALLLLAGLALLVRFVLAGLPE